MVGGQKRQKLVNVVKECPLAQKSATVPLVTHSPDTAVIKWIHYLWLCISSLLGITAFKMKKKRIVAFTKNLLCNWQKVTKGLLRKAARHIVQNSTINHLITKECNTNGQDIWLCLASTEMMLKFNMIFYDSTSIFFSSKHQSKAEFKNLDDTEVLCSDFAGLITSATSMTSTASFHKKYSKWWLDHP